MITLLPSPSLLPDGWYEYSLLTHEPSWWNLRLRASTATGNTRTWAGEAAAVTVPRQALRRRPRDDSGALFAAAEVEPAKASAATSLGAQAVASSRMATQRPAVRRAPGDDSIAALIDASGIRRRSPDDLPRQPRQLASRSTACPAI